MEEGTSTSLPDLDEQGFHLIYKHFWEDFPHVDIFSCFIPDLLHQLHKGVFKDRLMSWCMKHIGEDKVDIVMPDFPDLHHFQNGILFVSQ